MLTNPTERRDATQGDVAQGDRPCMSIVNSSLLKGKRK